MLNVRTSTSRLPADNFISGALLGVISAAAIEYSAKNSTSTKIKNVAKIGIMGGIAASFSISASNNIVSKNYTNAVVDIALGIGLIATTEYFLKSKESK